METAVGGRAGTLLTHSGRAIGPINRCLPPSFRKIGAGRSLRRSPAARMVVRASSSGKDDDYDSMGNPFQKKGGKKEDAARKAVEDIFKGQKDVLADLDSGSGDGNDDDGGSSGGGGGGGWSENFFNGEYWRNSIINWWTDFRKWISSVFKGLGVFVLFFGVILVVSLLEPAIGVLAKIVRTVLRLEKSSGDDTDVDPTLPPGPKRSVLFDDDDEDVPSAAADEDSDLPETPTVSRRSGRTGEGRAAAGRSAG